MEKTPPVGSFFEAKCIRNDSYLCDLTFGETYIIEVIPPILERSPLCSFVGDRNRLCAAHLSRFIKIEE